ncbi:MAG: helicase [Leptospiraceae bacterium]|nr:helicase [Leptospiraceae bacterium]
MSNPQVISQTKIREQLLDLVTLDLLGPKQGEEEEVTEKRIEARYILGKLAPQNVQVEEEEEEEKDEETEVDSLDMGSDDDAPVETKAPPKTMLPSSMGLSFAIDKSEKSFFVQSNWGFYNRVKNTEGRNIWKRKPIQNEAKEIFLKEGLIERILVYSNEEIEGGIYYKGIIRQNPEKEWLVSLFLVNEFKATSKKSENILFQPEMEVFGRENKEIFIKRVFKKSTRFAEGLLAEEEKLNEMAYHDHLEFAVGHNVSTHTNKKEIHSHRAVSIKTKFVPVFELPYFQQAEPSTYSELSGIILDMKVLSEINKANLIQSLQCLPDAYQSWIKEELQVLKNKNLQEYTETSEKVVANFNLLLSRLKEGIQVLESVPKALDAFRFANSAMYQQRIHTIYSEEKRKGNPSSLESADIEKNRSWRIFQLAFLLITLPSLSNLMHKDRIDPMESVADLIWFPTGGGKTEAYLGVTAFCLAIRRLDGVVEDRESEYGVGVIMRYTLRLLTLQQFQRSTALICACEEIRKEDPVKWGNTPFRIGLWVGQKTTPNKTEGSKQALASMTDNYFSTSNFSSGNPLQLTNCPWCGNEISRKNLEVQTYPKLARTITYCGDPSGNCSFSKRRANLEGIPIVVVDEEIYRLLPALIIATVDKFAQMPWEPQIQMLFGRVDRHCERHGFASSETEEATSHTASGGFKSVKVKEHKNLRPPDLIIQDELHLISGPLGSLVGLYETAIDELCSWEVNGKKVRSKIIASTATIRMASEQIARLYTRKTFIFPVPGLRIENNFFLRQVEPTDEKPGRLYLGINAIGERVKVLMIRVYLAFLAAAQTLQDQYGSAGDPYMTLVGYFNSIRELGGMRRLIEDDVSSRLYRMDNRGLSQRKRPRIEELTSRKSALEIPKILEILESPHPLNDTEANKRYIDVLLATNMISVGVDVKRFGLMVVAGQPKTTSEYIQATSRVGRSFPGIVCTVYNWTRPRDISHYERFEYYHDTFYRQVEVNSVTPFSPRALDRALNGVLVGLIRLLDKPFNPNASAELFQPDLEILQKAISIIKERAKLINKDVLSDLERLIEDRIETWTSRIEEAAKFGNTLQFKKSKGDNVELLVDLNHPERDNYLFCLNSLRDVESSVSFYLQD